MATERAQAWMDTHPEVPFLRRVFHLGPLASATERAQLSEWVTRTIMAAPYSLPWDDWPPRFTHNQPGFVRI